MAYADFHNELLDLVATITGAVRTDPDDPTRSATLFTSVETAQISIIEFMNEGVEGGQGRPAPPYWAVQVGDLVPDDGFGSQTFFRAPVTIAVLDAIGNETTNPTQESIHAAIEAVRAAIDAPTANHQYFWRIERGRVDSSANNSVFRALTAESKAGILAATLSWTPGLQVYIYAGAE